jgi:hypothetical protein
MVVSNITTKSYSIHYLPIIPRKPDILAVFYSKSCIY